MTVFLNANSISELQFHPPGGGRRATEVVSKKRQTFEDYFPRTQKHFPGYLCKETLFKPKLAGVIRGELEGMKGTREDMEKLAAQNTQGGFLNPALKPKAENYPKKLNEFHHAERVRQTNMELKSCILEAIDREDWYSFEKLGMADKMFEESKRYFKAVGTEFALAAAGAGIGKMGRVAKSGKKLPGEIFQRDYRVNGWTANRQWRMEFGYTANGKTRTLHVLDADLANSTIAVGNYDIGLWSEHSHPEDSFESYDCMKNFGLKGIAASVMVPYIGIAASVTNVFYNTLLGFQYLSSSDRIRDIEEENNRKNAEFLSKLKQYIYDDFNDLTDDEIEALMGKLGINKNEYISL